MARLPALALAASLMASAAAAQVSTIQAGNSGHWRPPAKGQSQDLNKILCEVVETTGTRLGARKVCKTALEWQQMRADQRMTVEKVQQQATSTGIPSG